MKTKLTRTGDDLALVFDKPLLEQLGLDENSEFEISASRDVILVTPVRNEVRQRKLQKIVDELDAQYGGVFERLSK